MADPKQQTITPSLLKRAAERVTEARLSIASHVFAGQNLLALKGPGFACEALALHPAGLLVVPAAGPHKGKRLIVPGAHVEYARIADEET